MTLSLDLNVSTSGYDNSSSVSIGAGFYTPMFGLAAISGTGTIQDIILSTSAKGLSFSFGTSGSQSFFDFSLHSLGSGFWMLTASSVESHLNWNFALNNVYVEAAGGSGGATPGLDQIGVLVQGSHNNDSTATQNLDVICFYPGTLVRTPAGEVAVETLKHGDLVLTHDGREVPIAWLGRQTVSLVFADKLRVLPIRIKAGALAENVPARDLLVSPDHAMFIDGVLIHAGALVNGASIVREANVPTVFTYYHIEVADHSLILAEGAPAETFVDNLDRLGFDNWAEYEALYPEGKTVEELPYPRAKSRRQVPVAIRVALAARAQAIGAVAESAATAA